MGGFDSPNLNLIERLWLFLRKNITYNKFYEKFSVFEQTVLSFLNNIHIHKANLASLLQPNFHLINSA